MNNCSARPHSLSGKLKSITLVYFPPYKTSNIQLMNQRIINNLKVFYRKCILNKVILNNNQKTTITLWDCISELSKAWSNDMTSKTIEKCFSKAGFNNKVIETDVEVPDLHREYEIVQCDSITLQDHLKILLFVDHSPTMIL